MKNILFGLVIFFGLTSISMAGFGFGVGFGANRTYAPPPPPPVYYRPYSPYYPPQHFGPGYYGYNYRYSPYYNQPYQPWGFGFRFGVR